MSSTDRGGPLGPVIEATQKTFSMMIGESIGEPRVYSGGDGVSQIYEVSAIIGLGGGTERRGSVVLSCPRDVARELTRRLLGEDEADDEQAVADTLGELVNVIGGSAKPGLRKQGHQALGLSLPTVVMGGGHRVFRKRDVPVWLAVFTSPVGRLAVQVSIGEAPSDPGEPPDA